MIGEYGFGTFYGAIKSKVKSPEEQDCLVVLDSSLHELLTGLRALAV